MNDKDIEQVLLAAGPREKPPVEVEHAIRSHLLGEWREVVDRHRRARRWRTGFALAAGLFVAGIGVWIAAPGPAGPVNAVATMALVTGEVRASSGWLDRWRGVVAGQSLLAGQGLRTGPASRAALMLPGGLSARMDHDTRLTIAGADRIILERGALYVDAGKEPARSGALDIVTPVGVVRHFGTQYEVRLLDAIVQLRVREGRVEWRSTSGVSEQGTRGEQLTIGVDGRVERASIPVHGESWAWIGSATPGLDIEGVPLTVFLDWVARELGCEIRYASPGTATDAGSIVLHGSIAGLAPQQALSAVLATTRLSALMSDGQIIVGSAEASARQDR